MLGTRAWLALLVATATTAEATTVDEGTVEKVLCLLLPCPTADDSPVIEETAEDIATSEPTNATAQSEGLAEETVDDGVDTTFDALDDAGVDLNGDEPPDSDEEDEEGAGAAGGEDDDTDEDDETGGDDGEDGSGDDGDGTQTQGGDDANGGGSDGGVTSGPDATLDAATASGDHVTGGGSLGDAPPILGDTDGVVPAETAEASSEDDVPGTVASSHTAPDAIPTGVAAALLGAFALVGVALVALALRRTWKDRRTAAPPRT